MNLKLQKSVITTHQSIIKITGSKSETNRLLLLQALYLNITLENISKSDDSDVMQKALNHLLHSDTFAAVQSSESNAKVIDVHHAGTAMRFLTAFFAIQEGQEVVITGSDRMKQRPIAILVDALKQLGANISYLENEGYPPLKIIGTTFSKNKVSLAANVSSQYISALLLIAPKLTKGLDLTLEGQITSRPYIEMSLALLNQIGVQTTFVNNSITVNPTPVIQNAINLKIESDWSSASYWYSIIALSKPGASVILSSYKKNSLQGDAILSEIYKNFNVQTVFNSDSTIAITKTTSTAITAQNFDLQNAPDIAQTIAVTCFGLGVACNIVGLHTLKIKETDRLEALKTELSKLGATIEVTNNSLHLKSSNKINTNCAIATYQDHRMAMAFAPLALKVALNIENANVVSKSYPTFWTDLQYVGFEILEQ